MPDGDVKAFTYARGKSREALLTVSGNVWNYRDARRVDAVATMPVFTEAQRDELADEYAAASPTRPFVRQFPRTANRTSVPF